MQEYNNCKYDVAVSYESGNRTIVQEIVEYIKSEGYSVFFDIEKREEILSEHLKAKLYQVYQNESLVKVLFVTENYLQNKYTLLEARRSINSATENRRKAIVVNYIGEQLPEPYKSYTYLNGDLPADEIAYLIAKRVEELKGGKADLKKNFKEGDLLNPVSVIKGNSGIVTGNNSVISNVTIKNK